MTPFFRNLGPLPRCPPPPQSVFSLSLWAFLPTSTLFCTLPLIPFLGQKGTVTHWFHGGGGRAQRPL